MGGLGWGLVTVCLVGILRSGYCMLVKRLGKKDLSCVGATTVDLPADAWTSFSYLGLSYRHDGNKNTRVAVVGSKAVGLRSDLHSQFACSGL
jgi:hypothetical protein